MYIKNAPFSLCGKKMLLKCYLMANSTVSFTHLRTVWIDENMP